MGVTKIQWTSTVRADGSIVPGYTFNPWIGCEHAIYGDADGRMHAHPGCLQCYAEADMDKRRGRVQWGRHGTRSRTSSSYWRDPVRWNREAESAGERRRVFCASLADVFEEWQGPLFSGGKEPIHLGKDGRASRGEWDRMTMDEARRDLFRLIDATTHLDWLLLTKRPQNVRRMLWPRGVVDGEPSFPSDRRRSNVWLGYSASDQASLEAGVGFLLACRDLFPVLFLSLEPLLASVDLSAVLGLQDRASPFPDSAGNVDMPDGSLIDWVIVGGESGHRAREMDIAWARSIRDQCREADVPCFVKQMGDAAVSVVDPGVPASLNHRRGLYQLDLVENKGGDMAEWPEDLRVREFPEVSR